MTGASLLAFRQRLQLTQMQFCKELGISRRTLTTYEGWPDKPVPRTIALACQAIANGLPPMA